MPRTVDATAILFKETGPSFSSKQSIYSQTKNRACAKTILPLGKAKRKFQPFFNKIGKITSPISALKSNIYQKLGISCVLPRLVRRYQPIIQRINCKLGLDEEVDDQGFINVNEFSCNSDEVCQEPSSERKLITRSHGFPSLDYVNQNQINTYDDCFHDIGKVTYGSTILIGMYTYG